MHAELGGRSHHSNVPTVAKCEGIWNTIRLER